MTAPRNSDAVFAALSDPTRRAVLQGIASTGDATATELASQLPVSRQAVVKHLGLLGTA
ncbi:MAG TPA: ArsR family transcriptional regulator, partial [Actinobacteria bacterium]|nr:ArsR family transcriptional regulator [Actinomycetota bacterium]